MENDFVRSLDLSDEKYTGRHVFGAAKTENGRKNTAEQSGRREINHFNEIELN